MEVGEELEVEFVEEEDGGDLAASDLGLRFSASVLRKTF